MGSMMRIDSGARRNWRLIQVSLRDAPIVTECSLSCSLSLAVPSDCCRCQNDHCERLVSVAMQGQQHGHDDWL